MAKAMLIMDMPSRCIECPLLASWQDSASAPRNYWCPYNLEITIEVEKRSDWCPLRECPTRKETKTLSEFLKDGQDEKIIENFVAEEFMKYGYNSCIDEILGGGE